VIDSAVTSEFLCVTIQGDRVFSSPVSPDSVVGVRILSVEVEDEQEVTTFEDNNSVGFILESKCRREMNKGGGGEKSSESRCE